MKLTFNEVKITGEELAATAGGETLAPVLSLVLSGEMDLPLPGTGVVTTQVLTDLEALELSLRQRAVELADAANKLETLIAGLRSLDA